MPKSSIVGRPKLVTGAAIVGLVLGLLLEPVHAASSADGRVGPTDGRGRSSEAGAVAHVMHEGRRHKLKGKAKARGKGKRKGTASSEDSFTLAETAGAKRGKGRRRKHHLHAAGASASVADAACADSLAEAKQLVQRSELIEARDLLPNCTKPSCGVRIAKVCTAMGVNLEKDIPSVIVAVEGGAPDADVEVTMDGKPFSSKVDGQAIPVNPGNHEFVFQSGSAALSTQSVLIVQGQRNRPLTVALSSGKKKAAATAVVAASEGEAEEQPSGTEAAQEAKETEEEEAEASPGARTRKGQDSASAGGSHWPTYALAGLGVAALGTAGLFTYWGLKDNKDLGETCAPNCNPASVDHIRSLYLTADIALGVGVVALAASTWLALRTNDESGRPATKEVAHIRRFDLQPTRSGGAIASVGGSF